MCMEECSPRMDLEMTLVCGASLKLEAHPENQNLWGRKSKDNLV